MSQSIRRMEVTIETFSSATPYIFCVRRADLPTFLINPQTILYYGFETEDGATERFLYSDIRHISFRDVQ